MNWEMIKNVSITCIFVLALLLADNSVDNYIEKSKTDLKQYKHELDCHKIALDELKKENEKLKKRIIQDTNEKLVKEQISKPVVKKPCMYSALIKKHKLNRVKYMFKKGSNGATLYCVDAHNNQVCYIDISSGIVVKTPRTYWGTSRETKFILIWRRK